MVQALRAHSHARSGEATRARILAAAAGLFAESGFETTTVRAIAFRSGVTDGALYYHFASKRDILNALWDAPSDGNVPRTIERPRSREDLVKQAEQRFDAWADKAALMRVLLQQTLEGDELAMEFRQSILDGYRTAMVPSFAIIYGDAAPLVADAQIYTLTGLVADTILRYGTAFLEVTSQDTFRRRLRRLIGQALPCPACVADQ